MRFVNLNKTKGYSTYESIVSLGCGPNFVLNRLELFEAMISEQGLTFWFRFWLTFCFHPCCDDLTAIRRQWPDIMIEVNTAIHKLFIQTSTENVCEYCTDIIKLIDLTPTSSMKIPSSLLRKKVKSTHKSFTHKPQKNSKNTSRHLLQHMFIKCTEMAFACALCDVFYEWLGAKPVDDNTHAYWSIPKNYLDLNFKPGLLEQFLVSQWQHHLLSLLDVAEYETPWIRKLIGRDVDTIRISNMQRNCNISKIEDLKQIALLLSFKRNEKRKSIQNADEIFNRVGIDQVIPKPHRCRNIKIDYSEEEQEKKKLPPPFSDHKLARKTSRNKLLNLDKWFPKRKKKDNLRPRFLNCSPESLTYVKIL